jgi:hypothetical protein
MNLVKWFRKNKTKVMAVAVVVLMISFVGGSALTHLLRGSGGMNKAVAHYGPKKHKITPEDRAVARQELEVIQALGASQILQYQDLRGVLLGELLFSQDRSSAELINGLRRHIQQNRYYVSDKQLSAMYDRTVPTDIYWILLRDEALDAGFHVRSDDVGQMLGKIIPQLYEGATYSQTMLSLVNRYGIPEKDILATFGKLWAVLQYAEAACSAESVTTSEIRHLASYENQTLNAECVQLKAAFFIDKDATPSDTEMAAHFDKYKALAADEPGNQNPYGFGYKLPDRIQIQYMALDLNDVSSTVKRPTAEEAETYYQSNRDRLFTEQVQSDPNDPNSPTVAKVQSYADVVDTITDRLRREKIIAKAEEVLLDARSLADAGLEATGAGDKKLTAAEMMAEAGDYDKIAAELGQKHGVALYSGRTGLLSAADIQTDESLSRLFLTGYGNNPIRLTQLLFSVEELGERAVTLISVPSAEMYRSIGPIQDPSVARARDLSGQIMGIVRIVDVAPAAEPENLDVAYSTKTLTLGETSTDEADSVYAVKDQVIEDLRALAAWDTTKNKAQELIELATKESWDVAISQFNERYGAQAKSDPNDPNVFELQNLAGLQKIASEQMDFIAVQTANSPGASKFLNQLVIEQRFVNRLYSLIPAQSDTLTKVPLVMEFKPDQSFYCLKNLSIQRLDEQQFQSLKPMLLIRKDRVETHSLAAVHFNPKSILSRTRFEFAEQPEPETDAPAEEAQEDAT